MMADDQSSNPIDFLLKSHRFPVVLVMVLFVVMLSVYCYIVTMMADDQSSNPIGLL